MGHIFSARVQDFIKRKTCPICNNDKILKGVNDLATLFPEIASEAYGWDPTLKGRSTKGVLSWKCQKGHIYKAQLQDRTRLKRYGKTLIQGAGCPYCSNKKVLKGFNDLKTTHPELTKEIILGNPETVTAGSEQIFTWTCIESHHYKANVYHKTGKGIICPICSVKQFLIGFNDLKTKNPELALEAYGWDASKVTFGSGLNKWWMCENKHKWKAQVSSRSQPDGSNCPTCAPSGFRPGENGYLYLLQKKFGSVIILGADHHKMSFFYQFGSKNVSTLYIKKKYAT
jgi:hypothetical protein